MKLCPNPACPHRLRRGYPAEFLDRAESCSDCTMRLVDEREFGSTATQREVAEWHETREKAVAEQTTSEGSRNLDVITGAALIGLSILLFLGSSLVATSVGGTGYVVAIGPLIYGFMRLARARPKAPRKASGDGPYREP